MVRASHGPAGPGGRRAEADPSPGDHPALAGDSLLWHRKRAARLFGLDYRIEVYTPAPRRVHGYYTMPILHDGHLIGRVDPKHHRAEGRLEVRHVQLEPWLAAGTASPGALGGGVDPEAAMAGVADSLRSLGKFLGAPEISLGRVSPGRFLRPLRRLLGSDRT